MNNFDHQHAAFLSHSTGTTGPVTYRYRSRLEAQMVRLLLSPDEDTAACSRVGIVLEAATARTVHGSPMPVPDATFAIPAGTRDETQLRQCVDLLRTPFRLHGMQVKPSYLHGRAVDVALVAHTLRAYGVDPDDLSLREVVTMAVVDEGLRRFLRRSLAAPLHERFSCSEIFGGALRRDGDDVFVTDRFAVAEVTDDAGQALGDGGVGRLTLTELYPFVQLQPLIRYVTGDIVQRVGSPAPGQLAFRWLGRFEQCLRLPGAAGPGLLAYRPLIDALGRLPAVARRDVYPNSVVPFGGVGLPRVEINGAPGPGALIRVGMSADPLLYLGSAQEVVDTVWTIVGSMDVAGNTPLTVELFSGYPLRDAAMPAKRTLLAVGPGRLSGAAPRVDDMA
jgi:hypothetical protein